MYACESECERRLLCYEEKRGRETGGMVSFCLLCVQPALVGYSGGMTMIATKLVE